MKFVKFTLILIVIMAAVLRFYRLDTVPAGFHQDEVSQAYNAFSLLETGFDRYGKSFPILFRDFGTYQPPIYTYLTTIPVSVFGNTMFSARFASALFGVLLVALTFFITKELAEGKYKYELALFTSFIVAISPWSIHFSRRVVEANLGVFFFVLAFFIFLKSLKKVSMFPLASFLLGISTYAYYSERLIAVVFFPLFIFVFRKYFFKYRKILIMGMIIFGLTLLPHIVTMTSGAFATRFNQVSYFGNEVKGVSKIIFITKEFVSHYISYFAPNNLFSDTMIGLGRTSPGLGVFYGWQFFAFLLGIYFIVRTLDRKVFPAILVFGFSSLVPAALTGDVFYPLRTLDFLWILSLVIAIGLLRGILLIKSKLLRIVVVTGLLLFSLFQFFISYFVLYQHETTENVGSTYTILSEELKKYEEYKVVLDATRDTAIGLRIAYFRAFDPRNIQSQLSKQLALPYYGSKGTEFELYTIDNITARPIDWKVDRCATSTILVGDNLAISPQQIKEHNLEKIFEIESINKDFDLIGYKTHPDWQCIIK